MDDGFSNFLLQRLMAEGYAFSSFDFNLLQSGVRTWAQMAAQHALPSDRVGELFLVSASKLSFVPHRDNSPSGVARVQACFREFFGDEYWFCLEWSLEQALTAYYSDKTWEFEGDPGIAERLLSDH